jgi:hypothetical protein
MRWGLGRNFRGKPYFGHDFIPHSQGTSAESFFPQAEPVESGGVKVASSKQPFEHPVVEVRKKPHRKSKIAGTSHADLNLFCLHIHWSRPSGRY